MSTRLFLVIAVLAVALNGCSSDATKATVAPSQAATMDNFVGSWTAGTTGSALPSQCAKLDYTITKAGDNSAAITYDVTCSGISIVGTGNGTLQASILTWSASGTVSGGQVPGGSCGFEFVNNTATPQGIDAIKVDYSGKICGITLSGSQVLHRK